MPEQPRVGDWQLQHFGAIQRPFHPHRGNAGGDWERRRRGGENLAQVGQGTGHGDLFVLKHPRPGSGHPRRRNCQGRRPAFRAAARVPRPTALEDRRLRD